MKKTEIMCVIDKSGSMEPVLEDTINGFNDFLKKQKETNLNDKVNFTLILFDAKYHVLYNGININEVPSLTKEEYKTGGMTALYDAIGIGIDILLDRIDENSNVVFATLTDGFENQSKEYNQEFIKNKIKEKEEDGWNFIFLAANQDAIMTGIRQFGLTDDKSFSYEHDKEGVEMAFNNISNAVSNTRTTGKIGMWKG